MKSGVGYNICCTAAFYKTIVIVIIIDITYHVELHYCCPFTSVLCLLFSNSDRHLSHPPSRLPNLSTLVFFYLFCNIPSVYLSYYCSFLFSFHMSQLSKSRSFDHTYFMWIIKQILQLIQSFVLTSI